ncbi:MAG: hypothetical protein ACJAXL_000954, partial [Alphaproteobacteria bacterium]
MIKTRISTLIEYSLEVIGEDFCCYF